MQTKLKISHVGFPPFSTGNCSQTLMPLKPQKIWRTINGEALETIAGREKRYKTFISGYDTNPPSFGAISPGSRVLIECIQYLWVQMDADGRAVLEKMPVEESVVAIDNSSNLYELTREDSKVFAIKDKKTTDPVFVRYSPCLEMIINNLTVENEEWGKGYTWKLEAEEI